MIRTLRSISNSTPIWSVWTTILLVVAVAGILLISAQDGQASDKYKTPGAEALRARAIKACNGPQYPSGAQPRINYTKGTFQCIEPGSTRR